MQFTFYLTVPLIMLTWRCKHVLLKNTYGELAASTANSCLLDHQFSRKDKQILNYFGYCLCNYSCSVFHLCTLSSLKMTY